MRAILVLWAYSTFPGLPAPRAGAERTAVHRHRAPVVDGHRVDGDRRRRDE